MPQYLYKCNNTGCPAFIRTGEPLQTNEIDPCPMCGHPVVNTETEEVAKTKVIEYKGNRLYYPDTPRQQQEEEDETDNE